GLKALAIYRENSKRSQPLSTTKDGNTKKNKAEASEPAGTTADARSDAEALGDGVAAREPEIVEVAKEKVVEKVVYQPIRKRLPDERPSITHKFSIAGHEGYLHIGLYPDTQMPGEIFITMAKQGSTISGLMDAFATAISIALQYGVPLEDLCNKFSHMRFEPSGFTNNRQIPIAKSIMDYIFRYLSLKFLGVSEEQQQHALNPKSTPAISVERVGGQAAAVRTSTDEMLTNGTAESFLDADAAHKATAPTTPAGVASSRVAASQVAASQVATSEV